MDLIVDSSGWARWGRRRMRCAVGRAGIRSDKREGDGATPAGAFVLRRALYRSDREAPPETRLPCQPIGEKDGWCDDPADPSYNQPVPLPHAGHAEALWREDRLYDLVVVLGYNDAPVVKGRGSAIFLHLARPDFAPTAGCVALSRPDLRHLISSADPSSRVVVWRAD